jgi:hypothetical protein
MPLVRIKAYSFEQYRWIRLPPVVQHPKRRRNQTVTGLNNIGDSRLSPAPSISSVNEPKSIVPNNFGSGGISIVNESNGD